ncbi:hypothetical protein CMV_005567 [Castanea mollissima]|uniref:Uncharacterized protein n=1 Tax=Castanea mollissima TaxID=60419 RepID=A0A8J4RWT6_9ROSI|nr:hypothetical protein CMV_005567 [Castanea mollissima]
MRPDATLDPSSLHGGCPVIKGIFFIDDQDEYVVPIVYVVISNTMWSPFQLRCLAQAFTLMYYSYHSNQDIVLAAAPSEEQNRLPLLQRVYTLSCKFIRR